MGMKIWKFPLIYGLTWPCFSTFLRNLYQFLDYFENLQKTDYNSESSFLRAIKIFLLFLLMNQVFETGMKIFSDLPFPFFLFFFLYFYVFCPWNFCNREINGIEEVCSNFTHFVMWLPVFDLTPVSMFYNIFLPFYYYLLLSFPHDMPLKAVSWLLCSIFLHPLHIVNFVLYLIQ